MSFALGVKTSWRKIAAGRYSRSARQSDDKNSIPRGCHFFGRESFLTVSSPRKGDSFHDTNDRTRRFRQSANRRHRMPLSKDFDTRTRARMCSIGRAIEGIVPLNERKINPGGLVITSYASPIEVFGRAADLYISRQARRNAIGTFRTPPPPRPPTREFMPGYGSAGAMNDSRRRQRANHRHAADDTHSINLEGLRSSHPARRMYV